MCTYAQYTRVINLLYIYMEKCMGDCFSEKRRIDHDIMIHACHVKTSTAANVCMVLGS